MASSNRTWVDVQKKTFTGWANNFLKDRIMKINDIEKDLEDGVLLINLLEIISNKKFPKYTKAPKGRFQKIENNNWAIRFIQTEGLKLVGIGAEDIVDGKLKLILGLIWTLILRYQIQSITGDEDENSPKAALLEWVRKRVEPYGVHVDNFNSSWQDARALTALTDSLEPGTLPLSTLTGDHFTDANNAMDVAQDNFSIPKIMDPQDLVSIPDDLSVMTYVSYFRDAAADLEKRRAEAFAEEELRRQKRPYALQCTASGPGLQGGMTNDASTFTIQARNFYGQPLTTGGDPFLVDVVGDDGNAIQAQVNDKRDGTYAVAYLPALPQNYNISVTLEGQHIKDSPFRALIEGAEPGECNAFGPGLEGGHVNKIGKFKIQARDGKGNPLKKGREPFVVQVTKDGEPVTVTVRDNLDGQYDVSYKPEVGGVYDVSVTLRDQPIAESPFHVTVMNATPENSYAAGPGLEPGGQALHPAQFTIHAVNVDGVQLKEGGDPFGVVVEGPYTPVDTQVLDNSDGTYGVSYNPASPGDYTVYVVLHNQYIQGVPKQVYFKPACSAENTLLFGDGLERGQALHPSTFTIQAKDPDGNNRTDGGDPFVVSIDGPAPVIPEVVDNNDGTYNVKYTPSRPGEYTVNVDLEGSPVAGTPVRVPIKPASSAAHSYAEGPGLQKVFDNEKAVFTIHAIDPDGKPRRDGGDDFAVKINGPEQINPQVVDNNDGTYTVTWEPNVPGNFTVDVTLEGNRIKNSPHHVTVKEGTQTELSGFGSFTFTVVARTKHGQPKAFGGDSFEVTITGPAERIDLKALDNMNGSYTAAYTLVGSGRFVTEAKLNGKHVEGSPFKQTVGSGKRNKNVPVFSTYARAN